MEMQLGDRPLKTLSDKLLHLIYTCAKKPLKVFGPGKDRIKKFYDDDSGNGV